MKGKLAFTIADTVIILVALGLTVYSGFAAYARPGTSAQVLIRGPGLSWVFPLDADETVRVLGVLGNYTVVRIHGGDVWAESSPCENQVCVGMGRINAASWWAWIACIPNNVMIMIERSNDNGSIDATAW